MKLISSIATLSSLLVVLTASPILWNQTSDEVDLREGDIAVPKVKILFCHLNLL